MSYLESSEFVGGFGFDSLETWPVTREALAELLSVQATDIRPHTTLPDLFAPLENTVIVALCTAFERELNCAIDEDWLRPYFQQSPLFHTAGDLARALQKLLDEPPPVAREWWEVEDGAEPDDEED